MDLIRINNLRNPGDSVRTKSQSLIMLCRNINFVHKWTLRGVCCIFCGSPGSGVPGCPAEGLGTPIYTTPCARNSAICSGDSPSC